MKTVIATTGLFVWLLFELKEFFSNGGFQNVLAFNLLKILGLSIVLGVIFLLVVLMDSLKKILRVTEDRDKLKLPEIPALSMTRIISSSSRRSRSRRTSCSSRKSY
jgi:Na+-transporting methylmalonyl-CoA/oxaloacetate decarboxylase gamma subunit